MAGRTLAEAFVRLRPDVSGVGPQMKRDLEGPARDAGQAAGRQIAESVNRGASTISFGGAIKSAAGLISILGPVGIVGAAAKMGIQTAASLEQAQVGFTTLLGSGEKAQGFLKNLSAFAAATPFELTGLIDSSRLLLGVGVDAQKVIPMLTAFGDAAGAVGVGQEAFQRIMLATSQAISAGKFQTGDLNQITENGIPIWKLLAEATGKPVPELRKLAEGGKLLAADVLPLLEKQMGKDYGGAMARQSQTLAGVWSTLKDSVSIGLANALQPLVPILTDLLPKGADLVSRGLSAASSAMANFIGGLQGRGPLEGFSGTVNTLGLGLRALVQAFRNGDVTSNGFVGVMERVGVVMRGAVGVFQTARDLLGWLQLGFIDGRVTASGMAGVFEGLGIVLHAVIDALGATVGWLGRHREVAIGLVATIGALVAITRIHAAVMAVEAAGGLIKYIAQVNIVQTVTKVWAALQWALNAALNANPIGIAVVAIAALVAGVIYAYTHFAGFREAVQQAWAGIVSASLAAWNNVLKPTFEALRQAAIWVWENGIRPAFTAIQAFTMGVLVPTILWLWRNVAQPAFEGISLAARVLWSVISAVFGAVVAYYQNIVAPVVLWLWRNVVVPAFEGIKFAAQVVSSVVTTVFGAVVAYYQNIVGPVVMWLWRNVAQPAFEGIKFAAQVVGSVVTTVFGIAMAYFQNVVAPVVTWLWQNVFVPALRGVGDVVSFAWNNVIRPIFGAVVAYYRDVVAPTVLWLWQNVFVPALRGVGDVVSFAWNNVIRPVFNALRGFVVDTLAPAVSSGIDAMGKAWDRLRDIARIPVEFVVRNIINPGIIRPWNVIAGAFGGSKIPELGFHSGGVFPGYSPGKDNLVAPMAAFSGGEAVMVPEWTRAVGGAPVVEAMNRAARHGGDRGMIGQIVGQYADGGIIDALLNPVNFIKGKAEGLINGLAGRFGGGGFANLVAGMPRKMLDLAIGKAKSLMASAFGGPAGAGPGFLPWPSSPAAQRGDSGVWRSIVALINSTGPVSGSFGNAYRDGDPLWHGSGRAVDWMGFNQDALASFFMGRAPQVLELIHRTSTRDYAITRGRDMGSFDNALMEQHRNHVHIAMAEGGVMPAKRFDGGGAWPTGTLGVNTSGRTEHVATGDAMDAVVDRLDRLIAAVEKVAPGVGRELGTVGRSVMQAARAT